MSNLKTSRPYFKEIDMACNGKVRKGSQLNAKEYLEYYIKEPYGRSNENFRAILELIEDLEERIEYLEEIVEGHN